MNVVFREICLNLVPHFRGLLRDRSSLDAPAVKGDTVLGLNEPLRLHLLGPDLIMGCDNELRVREASLEQSAELLPMVLVDGHHHIVEYREPKTIAEQSLHEC